MSSILHSLCPLCIIRPFKVVIIICMNAEKITRVERLVLKNGNRWKFCFLIKKRVSVS